MLEAMKIGCSEHTWFILLALLGAFLLGLLLGYLLWYGYKKMVAGLEAEKNEQHAALINLEKEFAALKYKYDELSKDNAALKAALNNCEADKAIMENKLSAAAAGFAAGKAAPKAAASKALFADSNLQIIEGIGPKIEQVLHDAGISSWAVLAGKSAEELREILDKAGPNYRINDPSTWPKQAELANQGNWDELIQYQKFLDTGRENVGDFENDSKYEKMLMKMMGVKSGPSDLKVIEGIGPKIEQLLKDNGIKSWSDLANVSEESISAILEKGGERYRLADPSTWPKQAGLAAEGKWDELREYQDFLQGGKEG
ncbi:MAG TPA: helix-hairpin-helix domain-containing protein [Saprospiraceae bacterium]|nr:helix-hairpin-helix domain-containing protein [Saprospiraceae bacterium]